MRFRSNTVTCGRECIGSEAAAIFFLNSTNQSSSFGVPVALQAETTRYVIYHSPDKNIRCACSTFIPSVVSYFVNNAVRRFFSRFFLLLVARKMSRNSLEVGMRCIKYMLLCITAMFVVSNGLINYLYYKDAIGKYCDILGRL